MVFCLSRFYIDLKGFGAGHFFINGHGKFQLHFCDGAFGFIGEAGCVNGFAGIRIIFIAFHFYLKLFQFWLGGRLFADDHGYGSPLAIYQGTYLGSARLLCDQESSGCINDLFIAGFHFLDGDASTAGFENIIGKHGGIPHLQGDGAGNSYDCFRYCEGHLFRLISIFKKRNPPNLLLQNIRSPQSCHWILE